MALNMTLNASSVQNITFFKGLDSLNKKLKLLFSVQIQ